ncbi:ethanolamine utilization protein EutN/carboxysome structural protein Ccml [Melioribacter roseus P3M-2]|uniref:Ethanolamine utilization protein EutN/carboxysome structural protein Ccml n=1 Tax=Melioribacter roseus (strain DSM 23840 / JCM 17771 / VKM B-2668 / P3M-2) TaxID=1191523 RepID=I6Z2T1_MELRP|nr:EutN/CcmL family microcompartment protein [Melioribacter roseus]AFN73425.1 ethanolamine utilization protein EutN/carboxysome structural protein Ccml [Melioribacter roseus P3M-2]
MHLGKVIGTIWATRKYDAVAGYKMQLVQPVNCDLEKIGSPIIALDTVGAGPGEVIFYVTASEAVIPLDVEMAPVDASIVGIVDSINTEK